VSPFAFNAVFGSAKLLYVASLAAYLVGQLLDIWIFGALKKWTRGRYLWLRAAGSTIISQLIDSFVVTYIAFNFGKRVIGATPASMTEVFGIAMTGYVLKFVLAAVITPFLYLTRNILQDKFKLKPLPVDHVDT
jgi:queuosine precursor transporter